MDGLVPDMTRGPTMIARLALSFQRSLTMLGLVASTREIEGWSMLVHGCMSGNGRRYHNLGHVFELAEGGDPVQVLAALFHDLVYYQVDGGIPRKPRLVLQGVIEESPDRIRLLQTAASAYPSVAVVAGIFGIRPGQALYPSAGLNEFLSALVAARLLDNVLPLACIAEMSACIEATIPFRKPDARGKNAADALYERLMEVSDRLGLQMSAARIEEATHRAVALGNRDVSNFAGEDTVQFIDNTWDIMSETNVSLRAQAIYTISDYFAALRKMEVFFDTLPPSVIFSSFRGKPDAAAMDDLATRARRNLHFGGRYLKAKLVAAALLQAVAERTGGDAPISLFMGDLPDALHRSHRMEDYLPSHAPSAMASDVNPQVLSLFRHGRRSEGGFDLRHAPVTALLYEWLGDSGVDKALVRLKSSLAGEAAEAFLASLPHDLVRVVLQACGQVAITRHDEIRALQNRILR